MGRTRTATFTFDILMFFDADFYSGLLMVDAVHPKTGSIKSSAVLEVWGDSSHQGPTVRR